MLKTAARWRRRSGPPGSKMDSRSWGRFPRPSDPAVDPEKRIDYVWLRGLKPTRAWVAESLASDHRMVVTEIEFPD